MLFFCCFSATFSEMCPGIAPANNKTGIICPNLVNTGDTIKGWTALPYLSTGAFIVNPASGNAIANTWICQGRHCIYYAFCK